MCTMCSYNPVCAVDGTHKTVVETEALTANPVFEDVTYSTIPGNTSTGATIAIGQTIFETLETVGDRDWFKIELQSGDRITFELDGVDHSGSNLGALVDPFVRLYSANGTFVNGDDDGGPGRNSNLTFTIQNTGTYYVEAAAWDDRYTGDYQLSVSQAAPLAPGTLTELSEFLVSGYWSTPRYWNLGSTGTNAKNGVLTYTLDGFSEDSNGLTAARANLVREAFKMYEAILGIDFQETSSATADFRFKDNDSGAYAGSSYSISGGTGFISYSRINVATTWSGGSSAYDSYTFQTILHEIGHALGLGHQGGYNGSASFPNDADFENDSWQASMMSYFSQTENTSISATNAILISPMTADWLALNDHYAQYGYGTSNAFTGNTVWGFNTNIAASTSQVFHDLALYANDRAFTIIDSGGNDTLDFSGYTQNQRIDLTVSQANAIKATTSDIGSEKENLSLAVGTVIENAKSGNGNDRLIGNEVNNSLYGGGGNDTLEGKGGNDYLDGGSGSSDVAVFTGVSSQYLITQLSSNQFTVAQTGGTGSDGTDTLINVETARFSNTDIDLTNFVPTGPEPITGTSAADTLAGTSLGEEISGLGGDDVLLGSNGNDTLLGGADNDYIDGGGGTDSIDGGSGDDLIIYDASDVPASVNGGTGQDTLIIQGGSVPVSVSLSSQGFELARHEEQDTSGQAWDTRTTVYVEGWFAMSSTTRNDDGSYSYTAYDFLLSEDWASIRYDYDASSALQLQRRENYDGTATEIIYDADGVNPWATIQYNYDSALAVTLQRRTADDASITDTYYDSANAEAWTTIQYAYNSSGALTLQRRANDDGTASDRYYDAAGAETWSEVVYNYNAGGATTLQRRNNDDGSFADTYYDATGGEAWTTVQYSYNANSNLTLQRRDNDDGSLIDTVYDAEDEDLWSIIQYQYDPTGALAFKRQTNDDGTIIDTDYDIENVESWDQRITTFAPDGSVIDDVFV